MYASPVTSQDYEPKSPSVADLSAYPDPQNPSCPTTLLVPPDPVDETTTGSPVGHGVGATGATVSGGKTWISRNTRSHGIGC